MIESEVNSHGSCETHRREHPDKRAAPQAEQRAFILPMPDRIASFIIAGMPTSAADCVLRASSIRPAAL